MKVLVACEFSGTVRDAFASLGHDAWSCDLMPSERAGNHIIGDCMEHIEGWDIIILHPPCTKIGLCGNKHYGKGKPKYQERIQSLHWTKSLWEKACSLCSRVALEQPKSILVNQIGPFDQSIQPWQFGHPEQKETWLWLEGLPLLKPTNVVYDEMMKLPVNKRQRVFHMTPSDDRGHERSRTYGGVAAAMAQQWGEVTIPLRSRRSYETACLNLF